MSTNEEIVAALIDAMVVTGKAAAQHAVDQASNTLMLPAVVLGAPSSGLVMVQTVAATQPIQVVVPSSLTVVNGSRVWVTFGDEGGVAITAVF